jgi:hypothetical protein
MRRGVGGVALEDLIKLCGARALLQGFDTPLGTEVLIWLLKSNGRPTPLVALYRSSRFSEPTLRTFLARQVDQGFVTIHSDDGDQRQRFARPTPKLMAVVDAYRMRIVEATARAAEGPPSCRVLEFPLGNSVDTPNAIKDPSPL